ncbi:MAG: cysteine desulfurase family protein [Patescibacteria group bacterium]
MIKNPLKRRIYLDYASMTPIDPRVVKEVVKYSSPRFANPSSLYAEGVAAKKVLAESRKKVADFIHAHPDEIIFTGGGTEANGLALEGVVQAAHAAGIEKPHIIVSSIEHSSVMETVAMLEKHGCEVTRLSVDHSGVVSLDDLRKAIRSSTVLVSIMAVNNETGVIQPLREIAKIIRQEKSANYPLFHTDAAQAVLYQEVFVEKLGVDLLTLDGTKVYGPRGTGCLYVKRGTPIEPVVHGGGQEGGLRSGTENIPAIAGFARALEIVGSERGSVETKSASEVNRVRDLSDMMAAGLKEIDSRIIFNGRSVEHAPHILNVSIPGIDNEFFLFQLDARGIACSTKSSCLRDEEESYVLKAMRADSATAIRFSFGRWTTKAEIKRVLKAVKEILNNQ